MEREKEEQTANLIKVSLCNLLIENDPREAHMKDNSFTQTLIFHALYSYSSDDYHRLGIHKFIIKILEDTGVDLNYLNSRVDAFETEETPLILASGKGYFETVKAFIEHGADINMTDYGFSAIDTAVDEGHVNIVELLIKKDAEFRLHKLLKRAIKGNRIDIVDLLLRETLIEDDADLWIKDIQYAISCGHVEIANILYKQYRLLCTRDLWTRLRTWSHVVGRFMRLYRKVVEIRYAPGGAGYNASLENYENSRVKRARLE